MAGTGSIYTMYGMPEVQTPVYTFNVFITYLLVQVRTYNYNYVLRWKTFRHPMQQIALKLQFLVSQSILFLLVCWRVRQNMWLRSAAAETSNCLVSTEPCDIVSWLISLGMLKSSVSWIKIKIDPFTVESWFHEPSRQTKLSSRNGSSKYRG